TVSSFSPFLFRRLSASSTLPYPLLPLEFDCSVLSLSLISRSVRLPATALLDPRLTAPPSLPPSPLPTVSHISTRPGDVPCLERAFTTTAIPTLRSSFVSLV
ncbi:hypothetical protein PFISCL1PPCAC_4291, partial [Pristionchus fissidentatus]